VCKAQRWASSAVYEQVLANDGNADVIPDGGMRIAAAAAVDVDEVGVADPEARLLLAHLPAAFPVVAAAVA